MMLEWISLKKRSQLHKASNYMKTAIVSFERKYCLV